jgi:hypothetical protein
MLFGPEHHSKYHVRLVNAVGGAIGLGDYLEAGSIAFLFTLADWLESRSSDKVSKTWSLLSKICNYCISLLCCLQLLHEVYQLPIVIAQCQLWGRTCNAEGRAGFGLRGSLASELSVNDVDYGCRLELH